MKTLVAALKAFTVLSLLTGIAYPVFVTLTASLIWRKQSEGQIERYGSPLVGQEFKSAEHFHSRPSAIGYNPLPSGGTNLGPISAALKEQIAERTRTGAALDLLTTSASGLDPHISPDSARQQTERVAEARRLNENQRVELGTLIEQAVEQPTFDLLGEPRINVLLLNIATDERFGKTSHGP
jgi:K+-transporting ATPase ATPase C chain